MSAPARALSEPLMTVEDLAAFLRLRRSTLYELVRAGRVPHVRLGRHIRFERSEIARWLTEQHKKERRL